MQTIQISNFALCQLSSEECAVRICDGRTSFSETVERLGKEQVSGRISLNATCEWMCNVVYRLRSTGFFHTGRDAALELKSAITKLCHAPAKAGRIYSYTAEYLVACCQDECGQMRMAEIEKDIR